MVFEGGGTSMTGGAARSSTSVGEMPQAATAKRARSAATRARRSAMRQPDREERARLLPAHRDGGAVQVYVGPRDGQTETAALAARPPRAGLEEAVEHMGHRLDRDALAVVAYLDLQPVLGGPGVDHHRRESVLEGVADEVGDDDVEPPRGEIDRQDGGGVRIQ